MNRQQQEAVLVGLARRLADSGSWTGETHLQKASYLMSKLRDVDFDFDFILYKYGPFSFALHDDLASMRADGFLDSVIQNPRYGARIVVTDRGRETEQRFAKTMQRYGPSLDWIAETLGGRGVMELERLATAMWMTAEHENASVRSRADELVRVKPHIGLKDAIASVEEIDGLRAAT